MRIELNQESADALRELAAAMPYAVANITESTTRLVRTYQSIADEVGPHEKEFCEMLLHVKKMQIEAAEAIQKLPPKMTATAEKIEQHIAHKPPLGK